MSTIGSEESRRSSRSRPRGVKALGIFNIVLSILVSFGILYSMWCYAALSQTPRPIRPVWTNKPGALAACLVIAMDDPKFMRFVLFDGGTALIFNSIMLATGIGLLHLRRWAARWWTFLASAKIARLTLLGGFFIVAVAP